MLDIVGEADTIELDLRRHLGVLRRRKWVVLLLAALSLGLGLTYSFSKTPRYRATAEVLIAPRRSEMLFNSGNGQLVQDTSRYVATEIKVLTSETIREAAAKELGFRARVRAAGSHDDNVVAVSGVSVDPDRAAEIVNTYISSYIEYRRETTVNDSLRAQAVIQRQVDEKQRELDALSALVDKAPPDRREAIRSSQADKRASLISQQELFRSQVDQLQVGAGLNSGEAQLLTPAVAPEEPFEPRPVSTASVSLFLGLLLGVGAAFLVEYFDDSLRTKEDLEAATTGLPVLGMIPVVPNWRRKGQAVTVSLQAPESVPAEAYRSLRTSIQFLGIDRPVRTLQLTSPGAAEGKTTTVANLAVALASAGQKVVVVDCDLRRSRLHEFFRLHGAVGFTSVVLGDLPLSEALQRVGGIDGLHVLAAGPRPPNPSELLSGRRSQEVFAALQAIADIVVIDSPPVLPVSDAVALATQVDATLLVANASKTSQRSAARALELLRQVDAPLVGTVLNYTSADAAYGYGYGYRYGYGDTETLKRVAADLGSP